MHDKRARNAKDACRVVGTQFLVFGQDRDPFALGQVAEERFDRCRGLRGQDRA